MEQEKTKSNPADYLANERTFLAWVRTSIGIMAFGFVVVKFSMFVKQLSLMLDLDETPEMAANKAHYSAMIGIILVVLGLVAIVMSYLSYRSTNKQLDKGVYQHSTLYVSLLTALIFLLSMLLVYYLIMTA
jgi:putative membrane protein